MSNHGWEELALRQNSPRSWTVAHIPTPETFAPIPTQEELDVATYPMGIATMHAAPGPVPLGSAWPRWVPRSLLITSPRCQSTTDGHGNPVRSKSHTNLTGRKNYCTACMHSVDSHSCCSQPPVSVPTSSSVRSSWLSPPAFDSVLPTRKILLEGPSQSF